MRKLWRFPSDLHIVIASSVLMVMKNWLQEIETKTPTQTTLIATSINIDLLFRYFVTIKASSFYCLSLCNNVIVTQKKPNLIVTHNRLYLYSNEHSLPVSILRLKAKCNDNLKSSLFAQKWNKSNIFFEFIFLCLNGTKFCGLNVKFCAVKKHFSGFPHKLIHVIFFSCFPIKMKSKLAVLTILKVQYLTRNAELFLYLKKGWLLLNEIPPLSKFWHIFVTFRLH